MKEFCHNCSRWGANRFDQKPDEEQRTECFLNPPVAGGMLMAPGLVPNQPRPLVVWARPAPKQNDWCASWQAATPLLAS